ncbi:MAG: hypothetical protein ABWY25_06255 [Paenisporosarcina sp.]
MRVTNVSLYTGVSPTGTEVLTFSLNKYDPDSVYMARNMIGLDGEELIPRFYGFGLQTKNKFYDFAMKPRDIVMRVVLNPRFHLDESYSDVRDDLYRAISAVRTGVVALHFNSGGTTVARIFGFITKFEVPHFSPLPEVQLTIRCNDPMFRAINSVLYDPTELPTVNPIIIADGLSTAPHGFFMQVTFKAAAPSFTIQDVPTNPDWTFKVTPVGGFLTGDILNFSSDYANKYLYITRGAATIYLVDKIQPDSVWPIIFPGATKFHFVDIASFNWNKLEFYAAYWGV